MSNTSLLGSYGDNSGSALMFRNRIINGDMRIDQRNNGASVSVGAGTVYGVDRWYVDGTTGSKMNMQRSTNAPVGFTNSLLITSTTALSIPASDRYSVGQRIEGFNLSDFAWGTPSAQSVTVSFWVRSSLTGTFGAALRKAGGTYGYAFTYSISAANTWEYKTVVIAGPTSETWINDNNAMLSIEFSLAAGASRSVTPGSWVAGDFVSATGATSVLATNGATWQITGVQLEAGPTATPFERRPIGTELALCQRYYERGSTFVFASTSTATSVYVNGAAIFKVTKRVTPSGLTAADFAGNLGKWSDFSSSVDTVTHNVNAVLIFGIDTQFARLRYLWQPAGAAYNNMYCSWAADAEL